MCHRYDLLSALTLVLLYDELHIDCQLSWSTYTIFNNSTGSDLPLQLLRTDSVRMHCPMPLRITKRSAACHLASPRLPQEAVHQSDPVLKITDVAEAD